MNILELYWNQELTLELQTVTAGLLLIMPRTYLNSQKLFSSWLIRLNFNITIPSTYRNENNIETIKFLHESLQPEIHQRMLEQRSKSFKHTPISISILNSNTELAECLLQQVTTADLFIHDFENNQYLH